MTLTALGALIERHQEQKNISDQELADSVKMSRTGIWRIKHTDKHDPRTTNLANIAAVLGIPHEELRAAAGNIIAIPDAPISPALVGQISVMLRGMTPAQSKEFTEMLTRAAGDPVVAGQLLLLWRQSQHKD